MKLLPPWRNMLATPTASAPGRATWTDCSPTKRLAQLQVAIQNVTQEQTQRTPHLTKCASVIKKRRSNLPMENHLRAGSAHQNAGSSTYTVQAGQPCPLCGSTSHPAVEAFRRWSLVLISLDYWRWKTKLKARRRRCGAARATGRLNKAAQRDENEAQSLRQDEQALTQHGKPSRPASISPCSHRTIFNVAGCTR